MRLASPPASGGATRRVQGVIHVNFTASRMDSLLRMEKKPSAARRSPSTGLRIFLTRFVRSNRSPEFDGASPPSNSSVFDWTHSVQSNFAVVITIGCLTSTAAAQSTSESESAAEPESVSESESAEPVSEPESVTEPVSESESAEPVSEPESASESVITLPRGLTIGGYAEVGYSFNFNQPSNGITHLRGFDNRHNTFTIANVALDLQWDHEGVFGRITLQVGHTPATYYLGEPSLPGAPGTSGSNGSLWQFIQQAYVGYKVPVGSSSFGGLLVSAGLFLSPIGPEGMAIRDNYNWSRSNLFFGLPFYHTGIRIAYPIDPQWTVSLSGFNGWNSATDNNDEKSIALQLTYTDPNRLAVSVLYFSGVERPTGAPEGRAWRHLLDAYATWQATEWLSLLLHVNGGIEPNQIGTSAWAASALYARVRLIPELFVAARGDVFYETTPGSGGVSASSIFWPTNPNGQGQWVSSGTLTLEARPVDFISFRLEYRHDHAGSDIYFGGQVASDATGSFIANRTSQDTLTLGATAWF